MLKEIYKRKKHIRLLLILYALFNAAAINALYAQEVAVLYPEIRDPYRQIFLDVIEGVAEVSSGEVKSYAIKKNYDIEEVNKWLVSNNIDIGILLGKRGFTIRSKIPSHVTSISGSLPLSTEIKNISGVSIIPDPEKLFEKLKFLRPDVTHVYTIYFEKKSDWLIEIAKKSARDKNLKLIAYGVSDIRELAKRYKEILKKADSKRHAVWIPKIARPIDRAIMQQILQISWQRNLVVFSSNFSDVKRGVLFSLYPNHKSMGRELGRIAMERFKSPGSPHKILLASSLLTAINLRTSEHLGLHFNKDDMKAFDFMYPPP